MSIESDIQTLEPGARVYLYALDASPCGGGIAYFHAACDYPLTFQGIIYTPWPIATSGFARTTDQQPMPMLHVGDVDRSISTLCQEYDDLVGAILTRRCTLAKYLDDQPTANPNQEFPVEKWFVERKAEERPGKFVDFEVASVLSFEGVQLPRRQVIANQCTFTYRGPGCNYTGGPVADKNDVPTDDPALDNCGKRPTSCKMRDWPDGIPNYGSFPAAGLTR